MEEGLLRAPGGAWRAITIKVFSRHRIKVRHDAFVYNKPGALRITRPWEQGALIQTIWQ